MNGEIIEYYYDDYPYPSCLICGKDRSDKIIHTVCGVSENYVHIITVYYPDLKKWNYDMKVRRKRK